VVFKATTEVAMVVIISRLFVVVVATLPSSFVAFTTKLRVVVVIFFWDECDDVLRSKEDSKKRVAREFNKDDDFGTQQGDAFMLFAFITRALYLRAMKVTTKRVERRFWGKSLQKKKRDASLPLRYPPLSSLLNFDENDDRNNNNDRNNDR
jgi:hypothetical protein